MFYQILDVHLRLAHIPDESTHAAATGYLNESHTAVAGGSARRKETATWDMRDSCVAAQPQSRKIIIFDTSISVRRSAHLS